MLVPRLYEDLSVLHQNTMPVHSYFIPTSHPSASARPPREDSDRLQMLSGTEWNFRYFPSIHDLKEEFYRTDYEPDGSWTREIVPFCWQMRGYDEHQYTNIRYPFPFDPPYVPQQNPCGAYIHEFTWKKNPDAPASYLHFEGVDSCFYVWLNGTYVGYSQVTHYTAEFDVTELLNEGRNTLAVLVLKWCDGSYLEDQDKFRMSGIIRDVYLLNRPEKHIEDYVITTDLAADLSSARLNIRLFFNSEPIPVRLKLLRGFGEDANAAGAANIVSNHGGAMAAHGTGLPGANTVRSNDLPSAIAMRGNNLPGAATGGSRIVAEAALDGEAEVHMQIDCPLLWNAETPNLYTLLIETEHEAITERVGFRSVCVQDGVVLLNGAPIKFRGVNRHESSPVTGAVLTRAMVEQDLHMIKENNFNGVRASHYPNVPYFYQLCDELGLYVIDEADNESHGTAPLSFTEEDYAERMKLAHVRIADNPAFVEPTLDRVRAMVLMNRNRPSVLVWSMGNECGYGRTFEESLKWTKTVDPSRLTTYESAFYMPQDREYDVSNIDLVGRMYPSLEEVTAYLESDPEKPLLLVEYCHSMGNSPGDFKEYRDLTEKYPRLCGGFVWEWCDHAVCKGTAENGKTMYWYGGDHGELQHDGNFCLDGLVYPDRTPHTGLLEYKNTHRPFRSEYDPGRKTLTVTNHWDFLSPADLVKADCQLTCDGDVLSKGSFDLPGIAPHEEAEIPLELPVPKKGKCFLLVTYYLTKALAGMPEGHKLGFDDIRIRTEDERNQKAAALFACAIDKAKPETELVNITEAGTDLVITGSGFTYKLDTLSGRFISFAAGGREFLRKPVDFNLWRAPTDNDAPVADRWKLARLDHTITRAYETDYRIDGNTARIRIRQSVAAVSNQPILRLMSEYAIYPDGTIRMDFLAEKDPQVMTLPRLGLRMFLDGVLTDATYFGIGPKESYIDKRQSGRHGIFRSSVADLHEDYIRPQENGSRADCDFVQLAGDGLVFTAATGDENTFSFNASVYTEEELEAKRHNYELVPCGDTVLCVDHKMAGIGSKSCGPDLSKEYRVDAETYTFAFLIRPEAK